MPGTDILELLRVAVESDASDIHLVVGAPPVLRIDGNLAPLKAAADLSADDTLGMLRAIATEHQYEVFTSRHSIDMGYGYSCNGRPARFRINAYHQGGQVAIAVRRLADGIAGLSELNLPSVLARLVDLRDGLVLVTGPTGSGKSTTLATLIDLINENLACHVLTVEDPIEYVHEHKRSIISQRELFVDVDSFADALRYGLREDPDVILVGEMRDLETMRMAIMAAETGHLVFSTLHSRDAVSSINRMVGAFPQGEQEQVRQQLSTALRAVVSQRLLPRADVPGRIPAVELMILTPGIANLIRLGKNEQIYSAIETGSLAGMQTMEKSLWDLYQRRRISLRTALNTAKSKTLIEERLNRLRAQTP